ncbi:hypothetical protein [Denitromonas iodatirespirans]|uniref:Lysozyme inhibitor n=1 Tax=Denitromonas iodatirespirans TaxID=2795389 RepID=A0A944HA97_DENI1|nr:hypothetical protein [Denitromonas iodatirespirans]MBT0960367.1 hypothetical protein [Denitromonas iodatirespirans]
MPRITLVLAAVLTLGSTAAGIAGYADLADAEHRAHYVCTDGERFSVVVHDDHVRLRSGDGVFTLRQSAEGRFQDPDTALQLDRDHGLLAREGESPKTCRRAGEAV